MDRIDIPNLVERLVEGDDEAQAAFCRMYTGLIERTVAFKLAKMTGARPVWSDVEDIRNDVITWLFDAGGKKLSELRNPRSLEAWLATVTGNRTVDCLRKQSTRTRAHNAVVREPMAHYPDNTPDQSAVAAERRSMVGSCMDELPARDRLILGLFFEQGLKYAEIAEVMGLNINTVAARLRRAKDKLRRVIEEEYGDIE